MTNPKSKRRQLQVTVDFLNRVGILCHPVKGANGFLENCRIVSGTIEYDPKTACPSNLLHEAGHIAVLPSETRGLADGDLSAWFRIVDPRLQALCATRDPCDPLIRAYMQTGDPEASAWAFAAGKAIGLPDEVIILDHQYQGEGAGIRLMLATGHYFGINGIRAAGFLDSVRDYPRLKKWLQD